MSSNAVRPRSHLESPFIESLRRKYPKACNRSLTNLSELGLSLPEDSKENRSVVPPAKEPSLSNWSKGLSSSQPDLLKVSDLTFFPLNAGLDIDVPASQNSYLRTRTKSISGLHLIQQNENDYNGSSDLCRSGLSTSLIHERLQESRKRMNEIANRITVISRSNTDLQSIDQQHSVLSLPFKQIKADVSDEDEVDDSAPTPSHSSVPAQSLRPLHSTIHSIPKKETRLSLSTSESKLKLEEIRAKLTRKCENLQKRREELFRRIQSTSSSESSSAVVDTTTAKADTTSLQVIISPSRLHSAGSGNSTSTPKRSGTDSDGDSGIDLSMKRSKLGVKNSLAPKLKKYSSAALIDESLPLHSSNVQESKVSCTNMDQSLISNYGTNQSNKAQSTLEISKEGPTTHDSMDQFADQSCESKPLTPVLHSPDRESILKECDEQELPKKPSPVKSVRFSQSADVIDTQTQRLEELKELAEQSAFSSSSETPTLLPDTALQGFDSDSELSSSTDSDSSFTDLTDIDPRIAQLALGGRNQPHKDNKLIITQSDISNQNTSQSDTEEPNISQADPKGPQTKLSSIKSDSVRCASKQDGNVSSHSGNSDHLSIDSGSVYAASSSPPSILKHLKVDTKTPSSTINSPTKPPRTHIGSHIGQNPSLLNSEDHSTAILNEEQMLSIETVQPYSIVDASAFKSPPADSSNKAKRKTKGKTKSDKGKTKSDTKPPLPKSTPPKKSEVTKPVVQGDGGRCASDGVYEDIHQSNSSPRQQEHQSRRSRLDKQDFEAPYSYSHSRPNVIDGRVDSDWESMMTDDDRLTIDSSGTGNSSSKNKPDTPSPSSRQRVESPAGGQAARGRTGSCNDPWGSNASLYSSNEHLSSTSSLSGSRSSLFERVGSFKHAAKKKMKSLKRSLSLDRLGSKSSSSNVALPPPAPLTKKSVQKSSKDDGGASGVSGVPTIKKSLSWRSLNKLKFTKKGDSRSTADSTTDNLHTHSMRKSLSPKKAISSPVASVESPNHFRAIGKLLELCSDGCQRVQLNKPPHGPYGFYIGPSSHKSGFFVTRLSDSYAEKLFCGLLSVGDEIKEINNIKVSKLNHNNVLDIIAKSNKLILKIRPNSTVTAEEWF